MPNSEDGESPYCGSLTNRMNQPRFSKRTLKKPSNIGILELFGWGSLHRVAEAQRNEDLEPVLSIVAAADWSLPKIEG
jgi:hypothetical protein